MDDVIIFEGGCVERSVDEYVYYYMLLDMKYLVVMKSDIFEY